jgi:hypothetical protein
MRFAAYDRLAPSAPLPVLPLVLEQSSNRVVALAKLSGLVLLLAASAGALGLVVAHAANEPGLGAEIAERPVATLQAALGLAVWLALIGWPAGRLMRKLCARRRVVISSETVVVTEHGLCGFHQWSAPIDRFEGLVHHIRSSVSGSRHELILVHPDRRRSVLLAAADRIGKADVEAMARALAVPEVPASSLYRSPRRAPAAPIAPALSPAAG